MSFFQNAAAVSCVRPAFRILKKRHPGQVKLELKLIEIHAVHRLNPYADELLGQLGDFLILTDNLPVEIGASLSPFAPKDNEHRLAQILARTFSFLVVVHPFDLAADRLRLRFFNGPRCGRQRADEQQRAKHDLNCFRIHVGTSPLTCFGLGDCFRSWSPGFSRSSAT